MESMFARFRAVRGVQNLFWGCCVLLPLFINSKRLCNYRGREGAVLGGFHGNDLFQRLETIPDLKGEDMGRYSFNVQSQRVSHNHNMCLNILLFVALSINVIIADWTNWPIFN